MEIKENGKIVTCPICNRVELRYRDLNGSRIDCLELQRVLKDLFAWAENLGYEIEGENWSEILILYLPRLGFEYRLMLISFYTFAGWDDVFDRWMAYCLKNEEV